MARLRVPVALRWSDMDAYAHVNNVEMLRLLEEARIEAFWAHPSPVTPTEPDADARTPWPTAVLDAGPGAQTSTLVARQEIEYLRPLGYRRTPVLVEMWIGHLGGASLDVCYEVHGDDEHGRGDEHGGQERAGGEGGTVVAPAGPFARAVTTLVLVDAATGAPRRIAPAERDAWLPYVEEPPRFRRRGR